MILLTLLMTAVLSGVVAGQESLLVLNNHHVRLEVRRSEGTWGETYAAYASREWHTVLVSGHRLRPEPSVMHNGVRWEQGFSGASLQHQPGGDPSILLVAEQSGCRLSKRITLHGQEPHFRVEVACSLSAPLAISHILSSYSFVPEGAVEAIRCFPDFVFTPQLRPEEHDVIGDHTFRAPAMMLQRKHCFAALVPDITAIDVRDRRIQSGADVRVDSVSVPMLSYGLLPWSTRSHVYYMHTDSMAVSLHDTTVRFAYALFLRGDAPDKTGYREV